MASSDPGVPPLAGVRVVSLGGFVAGKRALLAELGADVVKIESRERPDAMRGYAMPGLPLASEPSGAPTSGLFGGLARSARSLCLDLRVPAARHVLRDLIGRADVVLENLGPGTMEGWGCSPASSGSWIPRLVSLSMSGYRRTGPWPRTAPTRRTSTTSSVSPWPGPWTAPTSTSSPPFTGRRRWPPRSWPSAAVPRER